MKELYAYDEATGAMEKFEINNCECSGDGSNEGNNGGNDSVVEVERTHPYYGRKIVLSATQPKLDVEEISANYCEDFPTKVPQGGALYNGIHFQFTTYGYCSVFDIPNGVKLGEFALDGIVEGDKESSPHCNAACFSNVFYDASDEFPLVYVNAYNSANLPLGTCYVHRIIRDAENNFSTTLVQTITVGFAEKIDNGIWADKNDDRPYGNFVIDTDNGYLYVYTIRKVLRVTRFFKFELPAIFDKTGAVISSVTLAAKDSTCMFDCEYFPVIQDSEYHNGKIYLCCGATGTLSNDPSIRVVDLGEQEQVSYISLLELDIVGRREPESIVIYDNSILLTTIGKLENPPKMHRFYF